MKEEIPSPEELNICGISVISGTRLCGRTVSWEEGGRRSNGFLYIWDGGVEFFDMGGETVTAAKGDLIFLPKNKFYRMVYTAPATTFVLVNFELLDKSGACVSFSDRISVMAKDGESLSIAKLMLKFEQCSASKNLSSVLRRKELCYRLIGTVSDVLYQNTGDKEISRQIVEGVYLLKQTYLENLPISTYAGASHISLSRFRELFQKQFGMSPVKYRNKLRIERAKELLDAGDMTVSEVSYASGFENISYFYRCFKKETGEMPSKTKSKAEK